MRMNINELKEKININFTYLKKCTSTNEVLKNINEIPYLVLSTYQTKGKGTHERTFISPKNKGIYFSMSLDIKEEYIKYITPIVSVVVSQVIDKFIDQKTQIKWINDIYLNNKKICGILVERTDKLIIGIGINIYKHKFNIAQASSIEDETNIKIDINKFIISCVNELYEVLSTLEEKTVFEIIEKYRLKSNLISKTIHVLDDDEDYLVMDIDNDCNLVVKNLKTFEIIKFISAKQFYIVTEHCVN